MWYNIVAYRTVDRQQLRIRVATAIAMQQHPKYATVLELLVCSGPIAAVEVLLKVVFSVWSAQKLYHSTDRDELVQSVEWSELVGECVSELKECFSSVLVSRCS
jgi:hypothetical protein